MDKKMDGWMDGWTFDVHFLYTLSVQQDSGENFMKLFEYMTVFNKHCDEYRLSCKKLRFIDINIKRGEQNTGVILYVDITFTVKLVKILVYECILYDICIHDFHLVNEC